MGGWEFPALTRNPRVNKIVVVNPLPEFEEGINPIVLWEGVTDRQEESHAETAALTDLRACTSTGHAELILR